MCTIALFMSAADARKTRGNGSNTTTRPNQSVEGHARGAGLPGGLLVLPGCSAVCGRGVPGFVRSRKTRENRGFRAIRPVGDCVASNPIER
jgi:hypothetical protein